MLAVDGVLGAPRPSGVDPQDRDLVLDAPRARLRAGRGRRRHASAVLAGDGEIALDVECLDVTLADVTRPYLARGLPSHPDD